MSDAAIMDLGLGGRISEYRVVVRDGCTLIFGALPLDHMVALTKEAPPKSVMDAHLARLAGANLAFGLPDACSALADKLRADKLRANPQADDLGRWLMAGERGASSDAIVAHLRDVSGIRDRTAHPHDPDDLQRCIKLLEDVPALRADLHRMREVSPAWAALVDRWDELVGSFKAEAGPDWRTARWRAPKTYELMRSIMAGAQEA